MVIRSRQVRVAIELDRLAKNIKMIYLKNGKNAPTTVKITRKIAKIINTNPKIKNELLKIR
jgi:hypothetical protein